MRDRIKELRRVRASDLKDHAKNWRMHPQRQQDAMKGVLKEVGWASAAIAREDADGNLILIDGHLRKETAGDEEIPVLILDVNEEEADKILLTMDPLAELARTDFPKLKELGESITFDDDAAQGLLNSLLGRTNIRERFQDTDIPDTFAIVVQVPDSQTQEALWQEMEQRGHKCKMATMEI